MADKAKSIPVEELRTLITQEANRWADASVDAHAIGMMLRGMGQRFGELHAEVWTEVFITTTQINKLAATCARHEAFVRGQLAALGGEKPDGAQFQALH